MTQANLLVCNPNNMMVADSRGVTATTSESRANAKSRRRHKNRAQKRAKKKAERSISKNKPAAQTSHQNVLQSQQALSRHDDEPDRHTAVHVQNISSTDDDPQHMQPANGDEDIYPCYFNYQLGRETSQAEWVAATAKVSNGRIKASKKEMEEWVSPSASVRRRRGFARDTDLDTIKRYEHADMKFALEEVECLEGVDEGRGEDVHMGESVGSAFDLPVRYKSSRDGI